MTRPPRSSFVATLLSLLLLPALAGAQLKIGSSNTAFADPPVVRPHTTPCKVTLYAGFIFDDFNPRSFTYTPPADCPGPWAAVILEANFSISAGIQFDRTANLWIGPTNIYFGTTAEDQPGVARHWHVERNLTDYSSIFTVSQPGTVDLGNLVDHTYTGVIHGAADLLFYPVAPGAHAPSSADQVIAFSAAPPVAPWAWAIPRVCCADPDSAHQHSERLFRRLCSEPERGRILVHLRPQRRRQ